MKFRIWNSRQKFNKTAIKIAQEEGYSEIVNLINNYQPANKGEKRDTTRDEISELKKAISALQIELNKTKEKNSILETKYQETKNENDTLKREMKQIKEENKEMKDKITTLEMKQKQKHKQLANFEQDFKHNSTKTTKTAKTIEILDSSIIEGLTRHRHLGGGGGGRVTEVGKEEIYALKEMENHKKPSQEEFRRFMNEYEMMNQLEHVNIIKTYGFFHGDTKYPPSILLEFCPQNLSEMIKNNELSSVDIVFNIYEISRIMKFLHSHSIIHRDLKPTNILVGRDGYLKLSDFGLSKLMNMNELTQTRGVGTLKFMAPEILNESEHYDEKIDVYSFGVIAFFILTSGNMPKITIAQASSGHKANIPNTINEFSKAFINDCWNFDSKSRPSFTDICTRIENSEYNIIDLKSQEKTKLLLKIKKYDEIIPE